MTAERFLPDARDDVSAHTVVEADAPATYAAIEEADISDDRVLAVVGALSTDLPERMAGERVPSRHLGDLIGPELGFVQLAAEPGVERAVGLVARYNLLDRGIERVEPERFVSFDEPGRLKAVLAFSLHPQEFGRTLLSCEIRVQATDADTHTILRTTWFAVRAGLRLLAHRLVELVKEAAEAASGAEGAEDGDTAGDDDDPADLRPG